MAKKKTPKLGRPKLPEGPREHVLGIRARTAWKEWLTRFATFRRKDLVDVVDEALEVSAEHFGFERPPKR